MSGPKTSRYKLTQEKLSVLLKRQKRERAAEELIKRGGADNAFLENAGAFIENINAATRRNPPQPAKKGASA